jgi:dephospho-CoA kinase
MRRQLTTVPDSSKNHDQGFPMKSSLQVVGLTGGIASGKSSVSAVLRNAGIPVMDADNLGHLVLARDGAAYEDVVQTFGRDILNEDGTINRQRLGQLVFDDVDQRRKLEALTHPAIAELAGQGLKMIAERSEPLAVYEAALLVETGIYEGMDALIVVSCTLENQLIRLCGRDQMSKKDAATRIACQYPLAQKLEVADYVVENNGTYAELEAAAMKLAVQLRRRYYHSGGVV